MAKLRHHYCMTFDVSDFGESKFPPNFTVSSEQLGELGFRQVYGSDYPCFRLPARSEPDEEHIGKLMTQMGWKMESLEWLANSDRPAFTHSDLQAFCEALIEHEPTVFGSIPRSEGEDALAYVRRAGALAAKQRKGPFGKKNLGLDTEERIERELKRAVLSPSSSALPQSGYTASDLDWKHYVRHNPVKDTNEILGRLKEIVVDEIQRSGRAAKSALKVAWIGVAVGALAIAVTVANWLWTYNEQRKAERTKQTEATSATLERQNDREQKQQELKTMQQQLDALERNAELLEKRLPPQQPGK